MPFPLFTNPFHKSAHHVAVARPPQPPPDPVPSSSYSYNQTTPPHSGILKQLVSLTSSSTLSSHDSAAGPPPPPAARDRTQSLATTTTHSRASPHIRSPPASPDSSFKLESAHLIKKLKSYGSNPDKAALTAHKVHPRPPPLRLSNQRKPRHAHTHHASTAAGYQPSPLSPRSRSVSAAATVFDIVRPSRRRDGIGTNTSSILVPLTPPLPTAPLFSGRPPIESIRRDGSTTQQLLSPSPLPLYPQSSSSRPHAPRRASSLDSINTRFPTPHSKHPHYFQGGPGFRQPYAKASPNSSGLSHSECSEDFVAPSSCPSTAHTTPISCAHFRTPRSRLSSRDFRHLTPHGLKPHLTHPQPHVSLSPKSMLPSQLARPLELDPLELPASNAPVTACWTLLNISASSSHASTTTCLIPDLPGTILRLQQQTPTDSSKCMLEPHLHKVLRVGTDGNMLVEWEVRLAAPPTTRSRFNSTTSTVDMPKQPSPKTTTTTRRTKSKCRFPAMKTMPGPADGPRPSELSLGPPLPAGPQSPGKKKPPHTATSAIMLNLGTFRGGDMTDPVGAPATAPVVVPPRDTSLFPSMGFPSKPARSKASLQPSRTGLLSSSPASSMSCSSSSLSPAEDKEAAQETDDDEDGEGEDEKPLVRRRGRFDTYVPPPVNTTPTRPPKSASRPTSTPHARSPGNAESQPRYNTPMTQPEYAHPKGTRPAPPDEKDAALLLHHHHHYHHYGPDDGSAALVDGSQRPLAGPHRPPPRSQARGPPAAAAGSKNREREEELVDRIDDSDEGDDMKEVPQDDRVGRRRRHHRRRNSGLDSGQEVGSLRLEKSYWSETDTTTTTNSSVLNFMVAADSDND